MKIEISGGGSGSGIQAYADMSSLPATAADGTVAVTVDTDSLYIFNLGTLTWKLVANPNDVNVIGTIDTGTPSANGAQIVSDTLVLQSASTSKPGLVNNASQSFTGLKTFTNGLASTTGSFSGQITSTLATGTAPLVIASTTRVANLNVATAGTADTWTTARNLAGNSVDGSANVAFANKFIAQGTADAGLSAAQFMGALGTGIVKNTTTTGVQSIAIAADFPTLNQDTTGTAAKATNLVGGNSTTLLGAMPYQSNTDTTTQLAPNTTSTKKFLTQTGTGTNGAAPAWGTIAAGDVPTLNQSTTGSAATLTTPRAINGVNFDGSAAITVTAAAGTLTGTTLNATVVTSSLTTVGTIGTGTWQGSKVAEAYGGTNQSTYTTGDTLYASATNTLSKLAIGTQNQALVTSNGIPAWKTMFMGNINYASANPDAEVDVTGYAAYADAAAASPVDGTGGSPTTTITRSTSSPLRGTGSFLITKDAANRQGEGVGFAFTIDSADQGKVLNFNFDYTVASGTYVDGDYTLWIYDVTNATLIQPAGTSLLGVVAGFPQPKVTTFQTASNSTSYRAIWHCSTTSASAYTLKFDNVRIGPQLVSYGAPDTDWIAWTPTGSWVANSPTYTGFKKQIGDTFEYWVAISLGGAPTNTALTINLPSSEVIDTTKLPLTGDNLLPLGKAHLRDTSTATYDASVYYNNTTSVGVATWTVSSTYPTLTSLSTTVPFTFGNADTVYAYWKVPIAGKSSSVQVSSDSDTRIVSAIMNAGTATLTSSFSDVSFTVVKDSHSVFGTTTYTVPVPGWYRMEVEGRFSSGTSIVATNAIGFQFLVNGSTVKDGSDVFLSTSAQWSRLFHEAYLNAGDLIKVQAKNQNGTPTFGTAPTLNIQRFSGPAQIAASESVNARYFASATSISGSLATISWTTKDFDSHNQMSSGTYTTPIAGKFAICAAVALSGTFALNNLSVIEIQKNGSVVSRVKNYAAAAVTQTPLEISDEINCIAGDTLRIQVSSAATGPAIVSSNFENYISLWRTGS